MILICDIIIILTLGLRFKSDCNHLRIEECI